MKRIQIAHKTVSLLMIMALCHSPIKSIPLSPFTLLKRVCRALLSRVINVTTRSTPGTARPKTTILPSGELQQTNSLPDPDSDSALRQRYGCCTDRYMVWNMVVNCVPLKDQVSVCNRIIRLLGL